MYYLVQYGPKQTEAHLLLIPGYPCVLVEGKPEKASRSELVDKIIQSGIVKYVPALYVVSFYFAFSIRIEEHSLINASFSLQSH